jgi:hypothetical protein
MCTASITYTMSYRFRPDDELLLNSSCYNSDMSRDAGSGYSATGNGSKASGPYQRPTKLPSFNLHREFDGTSAPSAYSSNMPGDPETTYDAADRGSRAWGGYRTPVRTPSFDIHAIREEFAGVSGGYGAQSSSNGDQHRSMDTRNHQASTIADPHYGRKLWEEYCQQIEKKEAEEAALERKSDRLGGSHSTVSGSGSLDGGMKGQTSTHSSSDTRTALVRPLQEERDWSGRFKESKDQSVVQPKGRKRRLGSTWKLKKILPAAKPGLTDDECRKYLKGLKVANAAATVGVCDNLASRNVPPL